MELTGLPESGDLLLFCLSGHAELTIDREPRAFDEGDSVHLPAEEAAVALRSGGEWETRILLVLDPREAL